VEAVLVFFLAGGGLGSLPEDERLLARVPLVPSPVAPLLLLSCLAPRVTKSVILPWLPLELWLVRRRLLEAVRAFLAGGGGLQPQAMGYSTKPT
jgi:hypothetical protein